MQFSSEVFEILHSPPRDLRTDLFTDSNQIVFYSGFVVVEREEGKQFNLRIFYWRLAELYSALEPFSAERVDITLKVLKFFFGRYYPESYELFFFHLIGEKKEAVISSKIYELRHFWQQVYRPSLFDRFLAISKCYVILKFSGCKKDFTAVLD